ncbi:BLUF domain-containing protein [Aquimarina sp. ERC-38]|uniref:BLUF domain-containing protein n=1 Tax=Aquimarina sp. ERC-38 TaxID=2949996 RepID=UPI002246B079|nr:BLUF domain-containing protein [Aquimarina sp. ERC-38]UZO82272.1 BLUF domain-containing protein [Aquimarina sp. ERC-38]
MTTLIYKSTMAPDFTHNQIRSMLYHARHFNEINEVSGCIFYGNSQFLQMIEGEQHTISDLYGRIQEDNRHHSVELLFHEETPKRLFKEWNMIFFNVKLFEDFKSEDENFMKSVLVDRFKEEPEIPSIQVLRAHVNSLKENPETNFI